MKADCNAPEEFLTDAQLATLVGQGDTTAFDILSERYMPLLQNRAGRYANIVGQDNEDFLQEGMLALYRAAKGFDPSAQASFSAYAAACVNNCMTDAIRAYMRSTRQHSHLRLDESDEQMIREQLCLHGAASSAEDHYMDREASDLRARQIEAKLSEFEQQVLKLYLRGHTYQQISIILSTATKAVDNALQRVRRKLRPDA